jgi:membrane associated rhomboid family serine protease
LVTYGIIAACVVVYALQMLIPDQWVYKQFAYNNIFTAPQYGAFEPWRMLTSAFLHSPDSALHILLNMYTLWIFGQALEPVLGRGRFLAVYLISAVGGSVGYLLLNPLLVPGQGLVGLVGASGAIFGLFGAMLLVQRQRGGDTRQLWILIAINGVIGFLIPHIAWQAHLGGLVTGGLCAAVLAYAPRGRRRGLVQGLGLAGVVVLLIALSWLRVTL